MPKILLVDDEASVIDFFTTGAGLRRLRSSNCYGRTSGLYDLPAKPRRSRFNYSRLDATKNGWFRSASAHT